MGTILGFLAIFIPLFVLTYSLMNPAKFNIRTKKNPNGRWPRWKFYLGLFILHILLTFAWGGSLPKPDSVVNDQMPASTEPKIEEPEILDSDVYSPSLTEAELSVTRKFDDNEMGITRATFSGSWPFATEQGVIGCKDNAIYFIAGNDTYALTGFSRGYSDRKNLGWIPLTPQENFWRSNPDIPGTKISVGNIISAGEKLCN